MAETLVLRTAVGKHDHVKPLKDGRVRSSRVTLEFQEFDPLPKAFRTMVRGGDLDLSEMAIVTHLLAHHYGKPITGLAVPLWSRLPHTNLVCPVESKVDGPRDLENTKVGVRAYAQTSGVWVRGILQHEYGVDLNSITWVTMEDAHLSEYDDPAIAVRNQSTMALRPLMLAGELSAIMGEREVDPAGIRSVVPDAEKAAKDWIAASGIVPINHVLTVKTALMEEHPWLAGELMELFDEARRVAEADGAAPPPPYGLEENRRSLQLAFNYSAEQQITPRVYDVDELFPSI
ncbi:4,5-dihydroxyphthalate decarboxylase [Sinorhizobium terangae]|uniref:Phosphate ABC transporter substrate-binding protein n=1 Tax=Sinorhizobium terangae TaxID=110322 RepID=A0A6N7L970_SINTE|nr:phosphate ABC transporter substrate-binding protein [Sinorhizobium terangae]MBB4187695.1 4,5-dihydroxyphthalate decarboxylase [Sinorhizobium terangae]MQX14156.1 phosphate ABC transporter substrate-binding protein [Sinorhizobium terangae]